MCGICASITLKQGVLNGHANGYANGHANGHVTANGVVNGHGVAKEKDTASAVRAELESKLEASINFVQHRGPDARNVWISADNSIGLAHCRLSIQDLNPVADQPLHDDDGQIHAIVNGEIYDHDRLREELARETGYRFKSHSDSEVLIALYKRYGVPEFLDHLRGEYAFVIYDVRTGEVIAARDRFGIKPLFWTIIEEEGVDGTRKKKLLMGSEIKEFLPLSWKPEWDTDSIALGDVLLAHGTLFKGVQKIPPAHYMTVSPEGDMQFRQYWDHDYAHKRKVETRSVEEMVLQVREKLVDAVRLRLRADVPVGIYLSGGLDSSAVAGIVKHLVDEEGQKAGTQKRVACFSIAFDKTTPFDESEIARRTTEHLGVEMVTKDMKESEMARHFEDAVWHNEQHFFDLGTVGKYCLSELPRDMGFKVVLTGEGADEIFSGYPWFPPDFLREPDHSMPHLALQKDPAFREKAQVKFESETTAMLRSMMGKNGMMATEEQQAAINGILALPAVVYSRDAHEVLTPSLRDKFTFEQKLQRVIDALSPEVRDKILNNWHPLHSALYTFSKTQLSNTLLVCLGDRTEMSHSLEARLPFLDHELVDLVGDMPPSLKVHYATADEEGLNSDSPWWDNSEGAVAHFFWEKWLLREAARPFITEELYMRRKHLYTAPIRYSRDGPVGQLIARLLTRENVEGLGFVDWPTVENDVAKGFGDAADSGSFRRCLDVAGWVTLSKRFDVPRAQI